MLNLCKHLEQRLETTQISLKWGTVKPQMAPPHTTRHGSARGGHERGAQRLQEPAKGEGSTPEGCRPPSTALRRGHGAGRDSRWRAKGQGGEVAEAVRAAGELVRVLSVWMTPVGPSDELVPHFHKRQPQGKWDKGSKGPLCIITACQSTNISKSLTKKLNVPTHPQVHSEPGCQPSTKKLKARILKNVQHSKP